MSSDPQPWSNVFVGAIAGPSPRREIKQQKGLDLAHWPRQFRNGLHTAGKNDSSLDGSFHNTSQETEPLGATHRVRSLP